LRVRRRRDRDTAARCALLHATRVGILASGGALLVIVREPV
jgi:hypothetical protein